LQSEIAQEIALELQVEIAPEELTRIATVPTENQEAYDLYLKGVGRLEAGLRSALLEGENAFPEAISLFGEGVRLDPGFGLAYAKLAHAHLCMRWYGFDPSEARVELARHALDQALTLTPDLGQTYYALGYFRYWVDLNFEGALEAFEAARQRLPGDLRTVQAFAPVYRRQGRFLEAAQIFEEVFRLSPRDPTLAAELSLTFAAMRKDEDAARWAERSINLGMGSFAFRLAALAYSKQGKIEEAQAVLTRAPDSTSGPVIDAGFWVEAYAGDYEAAAAWLSRAPGPIFEIQKDRNLVAVYWGRLHQWAGEPDLARQAFRQAVMEYRARGQGGPGLAISLAWLGERDAALAQIDSILTVWRASPDLYQRPIPFEGMAVVSLLLGDHDAAMEVLEELMGMEYTRPITVHDLRLDPTWDPLRDHPRFQALLDRYADDVVH
jgi:tetratricopeptide (TPR) repeat protein